MKRKVYTDENGKEMVILTPEDAGDIKEIFEKEISGPSSFVEKEEK